MVPNANYSHIGIAYEDIDTPVITKGVTYSYDDLQIVNKGLLPHDKRIALLAKYYAQSRDIICFCGWTAALGKAVTSVSTTGTNSTLGVTATGKFTTAALMYAYLEDHLGQFIDNLPREFGKFPILWHITPNLYKIMRGVQQTQNEPSVVSEVIRRLKEIHPGSDLISNAYLGCTPSETAKKKTYTAGSSNSCMFMYNPDWYKVVHSEVQPRSDGVSQIKGLQSLLVQRYRPIYEEKKAIIYDGSVATT